MSFILVTIILMISSQCASEVYQKAAKLSRTIWAVTSSAQFTGELCVFVSPVVVASRHRFWLKKEIVLFILFSTLWCTKKLSSIYLVKKMKLSTWLVIPSMKVDETTQNWEPYYIIVCSEKFHNIIISKKSWKRMPLCKQDLSWILQ